LEILQTVALNLCAESWQEQKMTEI
jgi:hypothetical protein